MKEEFYAHTLEGKPPEKWQRIEDHLKNVAELARKFAEDIRLGKTFFAHLPASFWR